MIVEDKKILYFHVRKCAGTSVRDALRTLPSFQNLHLDLGALSSFDYPAHCGGGYWDRAKYEDWKKFSIVRNPYDRVVSLYFYIKKFRGLRASRLSFTDFCVWLPDIAADSIYIWVHSLPAFDMLLDGVGPIYNYLVRFEDLPGAWDSLNTYLGERLVFGNKNSTRHNHYSGYYNKYSRNAIEKFYARDLDFFEYEF